MSLRIPNLNQDILDEIAASGGNLSKVSRALGLDFHALKARVGPNSLGQTTTSYALPEPEDLFTLARPDIRRYAIAVKRVGGTWRLEHRQAILAARLKFDGGTHEMVQGRNQGWVIQYLIPRLIPTKARTFFSTMEELV